MKKDFAELFLSEWTEEIKESLYKSNAIHLALFSADGKLLFANPSMASLLNKNNPSGNIINPTFNDLINLKNDSSVIYHGYLTLGDYTSVNISILARVYRRHSNLLIVGDFDPIQLTEQNKVMHHLNREINNLQRQLIKEKHQLEKTMEELNKANRQLEELNATKDKFFSIIAHDLRNPFNSISGFCNLLIEQIKEKDYEAIDEYAEIIQSSSERALALLINLLEWAQSQTGRMEFNPEKFDIIAVISEAAELASAYARQKEIMISKELPDRYIVFADKSMIATILRNLVSNAVKFTKKGGKIVISAKYESHELFVTVSDNGVGMSKENLNKLFKIEENHSTYGTHNEKGTGLGLILCKEFIVKHGGRIWAESEPGKGSKFIFTLPEKESNLISD